MTNNDWIMLLSCVNTMITRGAARTFRVRTPTSVAAEALAVHDIDDVTVTVVGYG